MIPTQQPPPIMHAQIPSEQDEFSKRPLGTNYYYQDPNTGYSQQQFYPAPQMINPQYPYPQQQFPQIPPQNQLIQPQYPQPQPYLQNQYQNPQMEQQNPYPYVQPQLYPGQQMNSNMPNVVFIGEQANTQSQYGQSANGVRFSAKVNCYSCKKDVSTIVEDKIGTGTWCCCFLLLIAAPCCCLPFCVSSCKDKVHFCPNCQSNLGRFEYKVC